MTSDAKELAIQPDYTASWEDLFIDAIKIIVHGGNQNALKSVRFPKASGCLPSWIPDYNLTRNKSATSSGLEEDLEDIKDPLLTNGSSPSVIGNGPRYHILA